MDEEIQPYGLIELPPVVVDEQEPLDESDPSLESLLTNEVNDVDHDDMDVDE